MNLSSLKPQWNLLPGSTASSSRQGVMDRQFQKKSKKTPTGPESGTATSPALNVPSLISSALCLFVCFPVSVFLFLSSPHDKDKVVTKGQKFSCHHSTPIRKSSPALSKPGFTVSGEIEDGCEPAMSQLLEFAPLVMYLKSCNSTLLRMPFCLRFFRSAQTSFFYMNI